MTLAQKGMVKFMQDTIQKLVMLDRKARQEVDEIRESVNSKKESILQNKDIVYKQYLKQAEERIDKLRNSALQEGEKQEALASERFEKAALSLDNYYTQHCDEWVNEIFRRTTQTD